MPKYKFERDSKKVSDIELKTLIDAAEYAQLKVISILLYYTGARISEILNLKIGSVIENREENTFEITIRTLKRKDKHIRINHIPLNLPFIKTFREYYYDRLKRIANNEIYGTELFGVNRDQANYYLKKMRRHTGIEISWHIFRHSRATKLAEKGAGAYGLSQWLGHKRLDTSQRYIEESGIITKKLKELL